MRSDLAVPETAFGVSPIPPPASFQGKARGHRWLFRVRERAVSLSVDGRDNYTFDLEGRPYAAFIDGRNYRRGLDGRVLLKYRSGKEGGRPGSARRERRFLTAREIAWFHRRIFETLSQMEAILIQTRESSLDVQGDPWVWLDRIRRWDRKTLAAHAAQFHRVYRTVSILPPDQYMALVVQTSQGCPWNRCTFCRLYRDRPYRLKSSSELRDHLRAVFDLLGAGIRLRRSVFLGDANMLSAPGERILEMLDITRAAAASAGGPPGPFFGFADAQGVLRHGTRKLRAFCEHGLRRIYLGLETGHDPLLELLDKPGRSGDMVKAAGRLHQAGLNAAVIVLLGLGGHALAGVHERDTVDTLRRMDLGAGDIVYFSPLIEYPDLEYARYSRRERWGMLSAEDMRAQQQRMLAALAYPAGAPFTSIYDIRDFVY